MGEIDIGALNAGIQNLQRRDDRIGDGICGRPRDTVLTFGWRKPVHLVRNMLAESSEMVPAFVMPSSA